MSWRFARNVLLVAVALLLLAGGLVAWLAATESGTRWLLGQAESLLPPELHIGEASGTLLEGVTITGAGWNDETQKIDVRRVETAIDLLPLLRRKVKIVRLDIQGVEINLVAGSSDTSPSEPVTLDVPIELIVEDAVAADIAVFSGETRFDIKRVALSGRLAGSDLKIARLAVDSELGDLVATASARLSDRYDADASVTWNLRLPDQPAMSGHLRLRGNADNYDLRHELDTPYPVATRGKLALVDDGLQFDLSNSWRSIDIAAGDERSINLGDGSLRLVGNIESFSYELRSNVLTADVPPLVVTSVGALAGNLLTVDALSIWSDRGRLSASGRIGTAGELPWELTFDISDVDASLADARLSGSINARGTSRGRITDGRPVAAVEISDLAGALNGFAVDGAADLAYADDNLQIKNAIIEIGDNVARFSAGYGTELQLDASLELAKLGQLGLDLSGSLNGDIRAATNFKAFEIDGTLTGRDLAWREFSAARLDATFGIPRAGRGTASVRATRARANDTVIDNVDLGVSGTRQAHRLRADVVSQDIRADAVIDAALENGRWSGSIATLSIIGDLLGQWRLQAPTGFTASREGFALDRACLASDAGNGFACLALEGNENGALGFDVAISEVPLPALPVAWPAGANVAGFVEGGAAGRLADGRLTADAELQLRGLSLRTVFDGDEIAADFERAIATAAVEDNRLDGRFELRLLDSIDNLSGELTIADVFDQQSTISGTGAVELNELALLSFFVPSVTNPTGRIAGKVAIAGSLAAPDFVGEIALSDGSFGLARAGITVTDVGATLRQSDVGRLAIEGRASSGDGSLVITGVTSMNASSGIRTELTLNGQNFALLRLPDWQVTASPAITVMFDESQARIRGELGIPAANVTFRELPAGVQKPSPDAVIHRGETESVPRRFVVDLDVRTSLGDAVFLSGFGLTTGLEGSVRISGRSDTTYTSSGRVVLIDGRYSAYGQELQIDSGELIFSGPLANPTLNVRASRTASDGTVAGILLTGTPKQPRSELYSEPTLSDVEALSYLLTGRPLSNATGEQGDTLNQAAFALGLTSAGSVVSRVRNELGLETLGVQGSADNRQFFAGRRFGSRLFVEYAYGIVDNLGTLLLRYQLNNRLVVESRSGTVRTVDVVYSVKKP